jgi:hypothetical protein
MSRSVHRTPAAPCASIQIRTADQAVLINMIARSFGTPGHPHASRSLIRQPPSHAYWVWTPLSWATRA